MLSNAPLVKANRMPDSHVSLGHVCVDLGEDEFTQGRLHPMIDPSLRNRRILQEARDPATAVILLDIVLGYGAHPDPAGATVEAIREAQRLAAAAGRHVVFVASVCGTEGDPQPLSSPGGDVASGRCTRAAGQRFCGAAGGVDHAGIAQHAATELTSLQEKWPRNAEVSRGDQQRTAMSE